ncbi:hypothetical protein GXM_06240 [Nostoc sphaeroides CCNUC1]|uniref:Uncharacterized protein n=1 Tax=Nostoc sphaeroides CCNUC1 TaxID=2653204 RepID=A0A5P8W971_9NOSO|nr:hypothetical protein GXM_06240 [Nostoc sphaeroides CCNUC1]
MGHWAWRRDLFNIPPYPPHLPVGERSRTTSPSSPSSPNTVQLSPKILVETRNFASLQV